MNTRRIIAARGRSLCRTCGTGGRDKGCCAVLGKIVYSYRTCLRSAKKQQQKTCCPAWEGRGGLLFFMLILRITSHSIAKSIVIHRQFHMWFYISPQPVKNHSGFYLAKSGKVHYNIEGFHEKAGAEQGSEAQKCKGIKRGEGMNIYDIAAGRTSISTVSWCSTIKEM